MKPKHPTIPMFGVKSSQIESIGHMGDIRGTTNSRGFIAASRSWNGGLENMGVHITIDDEDIDVMGVERCRAILAALEGVAEEELRLSYILAVSGAMRWPRSMRPEALVAATCDVL